MSQLQYRDTTQNGWSLKIASNAWSNELWATILAKIQEQVPTRHPLTIRLDFAQDGQQKSYFLKIYYSKSTWDSVKDWFRNSKAIRFLKQGVALSQAGFPVPLVIAAGEKRHFGILKTAFVVTLEVEGLPLPVFLKQNAGVCSAALSLTQKRIGLQSLARQIRRFHNLGFVHGDLVPSNIHVRLDSAKNLQFYLMDNDRTRRYPRWLPQSLWKRNLVQLNRFPLASISLQDRIRFFREYSSDSRAELDRSLLQWLEGKTRQRRRECDSIDSTISFRRLMRW
jgi:Lipopolysaccharide kinase (Kdo/WaaP) family